MRQSIVIFTLVVMAGLSGCAQILVGSKESESAPRLEVDAAGKPSGWDGVSKFGPVPASLQTSGNSVCRNAGYGQAVGYHSRAMDANGKRLPDGGYLCS